MCVKELPFKNHNEIGSKPTPTLPEEYQEFNELLKGLILFHLTYLITYFLFNLRILQKNKNERFSIIQVDNKLKNILINKVCID